MDEKDAIITYERLYELLRLEKYNKELQTLDQPFFDHVVTYIQDKKNTLTTQESKESIFAAQTVHKTHKQLENIRKILQELYERRESKIVQLAIFASRADSTIHTSNALLPEEDALYTQLVTTLTRHRQTILHTLLEGKRPLAPQTKDIKNEEKPPQHKVVRFLEAVPQFVGEDMNVYGPYHTADVATIPVKVSEVLLKNKHAEEL